MNKKIVVVPLDDRPCCYDFSQKIGLIGHLHVIQPPKEWLGHFMTPGDGKTIESWLEEKAQYVDGLIIAIDQLAYGGLVASRSMERTLEDAIQRVQVIRRIRQKHPHITIYAANVLMRISITSKNAEYAKYWEDIHEYSQLYDRVHRLQEEDRAADLKELEHRIPVPILDEYWQARKRNHAMNQYMVEWAAEGIIDFLAITQEDASAVGIHLSEQKALMRLLYDRQVMQKVMIYPGADEAIQTLLARMSQSFSDQSVKVYPRYSSAAGKLCVASFEDRPVEESVRAHIGAAGGICVDSPHEADIILCVNTPVDEYGLHDVDGHREEGVKAYFNSRHQLWDMRAAIINYLFSGKPVAVADIAFPNASDCELIQFLLSDNLYFRLTGYAGWNTAGNSLGTVISHAINRLSVQGGKQIAETNCFHYAFLAERLMDEWAYQACVRGEVNRWIQENLAVHPTHLEDHYAQVNTRVQEELLKYFSIVKKHFNHIHGEEYKLELSQIGLPWNRTFEVFVSIDCDSRDERMMNE